MTILTDDGFPDTVTEDSGDDATGLVGVYGERLKFIQKEANALLEKLSSEYHSIQERINARADEETQNASEAIERNRQLAMEGLDRDFNQKRAAIDSVAQQQIQYTYRMANHDQTRKSTDNLLTSPSRVFRPPLPFSVNPRPMSRDLLEPPQIYLPVINAVVDFPRIYIKPYDTPALTPVNVKGFPDLYNSNTPSI